MTVQRVCRGNLAAMTTMALFKVNVISATISVDEVTQRDKTDRRVNKHGAVGN